MNGSCEKDAVVANTEYFVFAESDTHYTAFVLFKLHFRNSVLAKY